MPDSTDTPEVGEAGTGSGVRPYTSADHDAVVRIWRECGWIGDGDNEAKALGEFAAAGHASVALVGGEPESFGEWMPGSVQHGNTELSLCHIATITTSRLGRRRGFASTLSERCLAQGAEAGFAVASLGIFDEGFYDRFGFGTGAGISHVSFDPASMQVDAPYRTPIRLSPDDAVDMQAAMANRLKQHGAVTLDPAEYLKVDWQFQERLFAVGYRNDAGRLTHFIAGAPNGAHTKYEIWVWAYETVEQLLELLRLITELGDQAVSIDVIEPPHVRLHDLIARPRRQRRRSMKSEHESGVQLDAWWQMRILDLHACIEVCSIVGPSVEFNLTLTDPLAASATSTWAGIGGDYTVRLGETSTVTEGHTSGLMQLDASVGAFTRMWLAVLPASQLTVTDKLSGPPALLANLDRAFALPTPKPGMPL